MVIMFAVLAALCGGAIALAESRDRPRRRALRAAEASQTAN
jgi:hypothetical protein